MDDWNEQWQRWGDLIVRSWDDEALRTRILNDPRAVLAEIGVRLPDGFDVRVVATEAPIGESDERTLVLPLPPRPDDRRASRELTERELERVSGGGLGLSFASLEYGGYLAANISPINVPSGWPGKPSP